MYPIFQAKLEEQTQKAEKERVGAKTERVKAAAINEKLASEKAELEDALARGDEVVKEMSGKVKQLETEKNQLDKQVRAYWCHYMYFTNTMFLIICIEIDILKTNLYYLHFIILFTMKRITISAVN